MKKNSIFNGLQKWVNKYSEGYNGAQTVGAVNPKLYQLKIMVRNTSCNPNFETAFTQIKFYGQQSKIYIFVFSISPIIDLFLPSFIPHCFELEQHAHVSEVDIPLQLHLEFPEIQELGYEYTIM